MSYIKSILTAISEKRATSKAENPLTRRDVKKLFLTAKCLHENNNDSTRTKMFVLLKKSFKKIKPQMSVDSKEKAIFTQTQVFNKTEAEIISLLGEWNNLYPRAQNTDVKLASASLFTLFAVDEFAHVHLDRPYNIPLLVGAFLIYASFLVGHFFDRMNSDVHNAKRDLLKAKQDFHSKVTALLKNEAENLQ